MDWQAAADTGIEILTAFGYRAAGAIAILIVGRFAAKLLTALARKGMVRFEIEDTLEQFVCNLLYAMLMVFVVVATINQLGIQTTSLVAVLGAAGLAIGLALQGSLSNFAAGVLIVLFKPYKVGDFVEAAGEAGKVRDVQIFTTLLTTGDNKLIMIPNSQIMSGTITNYSANDTRRVDLVAGCGYDDDLDKVRKVLEDIIAAEDRILDEPSTTIAISELADSSVNFVVRPWVRSEDYWGVYFALNEAIKKRFDEEGISIPYPQQDVHLYQHGAEA